MRKNSSLIGMTIICLFIAACSILTSETRTAEQWLELVNSGLVAEDEFRFNGSVVMGFSEGLEMKPYSFSGEFQQHKQIAFHSEQASININNPMQELDFITRHSASSEIIHYGLDETQSTNVVVLQVKVDEEALTERWKQLLRQDLEKITKDVQLNAASVDNQSAQLLGDEIKKSKQNLETMLEQLQVSMTAEVTIDTSRIVPLQIKESTNLHYIKEDKEYTEYRKTNIRFDLSPEKVIR